MREIKFRQWMGNRFSYWGFLDKPKCFASPSSSNQFGGLSGLNTTHQQFTGLQDSKGVDIYEGDIVRYRCKSGSLSWDEPHPVVWRHTAFRFGNFGLGFNMPGVLEEHENQPFLTVIGNIYEDKELIK